MKSIIPFTVALLITITSVAASPPRTLVSFDGWEGGRIDREITHENNPTVRWNHGESPSLRMKEPPRDWSTHNSIRFWVYSHKKTESRFVFIIRSENDETEGMDYWMGAVKLDFTGWREIIVDRRRMREARNPRGWNQIDEAYFTASGWGNTPDPETTVNIGGVELIDVVGPRLTDAELFDKLDLSLPELSAVRDALEREGIESAKKELARYLRNRDKKVWRFDPRERDRSISYNRRAAEDTVSGKINVISIWHTFPDGKIDWFYNPTIERDDLPVDYEWQWQLGRMSYWNNLGRAYWATGDERYARTFVDHVRSWAEQCPRPDDSGNYANSAWRTIECGIRMGGSWPEAYHRFLLSPSFTDEDIVLFLKLCVEHGIHLRRYPTSGNWLTMEMSGLYTLGTVFPELKDAGEWRSFAVQTMYEELERQILPDGAQIELTPGYHQVALNNMLKIPYQAQICGRFDELPPDYIKRTERAFDFNMALMTPDRDLPRFNDSWHVNVQRSMQEAARLFPDREDFIWIATDGEKGTPPKPISRLLEYAGYVAMRSGWGRTDNFLAFDVGPLGYGHVHQDKLNIVLWSYGREIIFDAGGGAYERSKWRAYDTDTYSHNTVLVDGKPQRRQTRDRWANVSKEPIDAGWQSNELFDYAVGTYEDGYGKEDDRIATHRREVVFLKPDIFVVVDTLLPNDDEPHSYEARWHLRTTNAVRDDGIAAITTADPGRSNLSIVPLITDGLEVKAVSAQTEPELLGWFVNKNSTQNPATTVVHRVKGAGRKRLATLLMPTAPDSDLRIVGVENATASLSDGRKVIVSDNSVSLLPADGAKVTVTLR